MSGQTPLDRRGELRTVFYTNLSRRAGERVADFASRFRTTAADLKAEGVRLPDSELGWFLKEKLGLDALRKQMLETALAGREAYGDVESESLRLFRDLHLPDPLFKRLGSEAKGGGKLTVRRIFGVGRPPSSSATSTSGARTSEGSRRSSWSSLPASSFSRRTSVGSTRQVQVAEADEAEDQETEHEAETAAEEPKGERSFEEVLQAEVEQLAEEIAEAEEAGVDAETLEALECGIEASAEALVSMREARSKLAEVRKDRGYRGPTSATSTSTAGPHKPKAGSSSIAARKASSKHPCYDCLGIGHWAGDPECPKPGAGLGRKQPGKTKQVRIAERVAESSPGHEAAQAESYEANPPHDVMMISHAGLDLEQALRALDNAREALAMGIGYAVDKALVGALDSACNRTCAGEDWLRDYVEHVRAFAPDWVKAMMKTEPETENFRFGNGGTLPSRLRHKVPAVICDRVVFLWISTVPVNSLGLLIGRDALDCLQAVLDFSRRTLKCEVFGDNVPVTPLEKLTAGHLALPLAPERWPEKLPKARWHRMGLDGVLEMQLSCRLWTRHLLQRETVTAQGEHNHYMTEASACLAKLAYQFRHRGCDGSFQMPGKINLVRSPKHSSTPASPDGYPSADGVARSFSTAAVRERSAPDRPDDNQSDRPVHQGRVPVETLRSSTYRPPRMALRRTSSMASKAALFALVACAVSCCVHGGRGDDEWWHSATSVGRSHVLRSGQPGVAHMVQEPCGPGVLLSRGPDGERDAGCPFPEGPLHRDEEPGCPGRGRRSGEESRSTEGGQAAHWPTWRVAGAQGGPHQARDLAAHRGLRPGQGGRHPEQDSAPHRRSMCECPLGQDRADSLRNPSDFIDHFLGGLCSEQKQLWERHGADLGANVLRTFFESGARECYTVTARVGSQRHGPDQPPDGGNGRSLPGHVQPAADARDAGAERATSGFRHLRRGRAHGGAQRGLPGGGSPAKSCDFGSPHPDVGMPRFAVKPAQKQLISQAWARHRRDQLALSMAPSRVKEVMFSEWNLHMRKGMNETFVLEVPLLTEVFTDTENVKRQAELRGHVTGPSMTLWSGFDFRRRHDRDRALAVVREKKPYFVMIAFPCGPWSPLQHLRAGPDLLRAKQAEGRVLIRFAVALAEEQARGGRHFIIENPDLSTAWRQLRLQKLLRQFLSVRLDQCCFGLRGPGGGLHKKPTRLLTSSQAVVSRFQGARCNGQHQHEHVIGGGKITEAAGHYTKSFAKAVVEAMENQFDYETRCSSESRKVSECYVVLADGSLELEHEVLAADNAEQPDDFDFEAASEDDEIVAQDVKVEISPAVRAADRRIHEATGHRSNRRLARALIVSGAPLEAVMAAKTLKCAVCEERKAPKARRPASLPPPLQVGEQVHLDLVVVEDALGQPFVVAHATDAVSKYQLAELLPDKTSESVIKFLTRLWWPILGAPRVIVADQGREFISQTFSDFCESRSTLLWHCAVQAPWMNGTAERSGGILKTLVTHMVAEKSITGAEEMAAVVAEAAEGVSPLQAVTGRQPAAEGSVLHNFHGRLSEHGLIDTSPTLTWRMALRESARVGMVRLHYSQTIRKAELARSREPTTRSLPVPGDVCFFFRQQKVNPKKGDPRTSTSSSRRRVELKRWHGPAILVALEGGSGGVPGSAFLSYRGQLTKCSVEHIRKASSLEQLAAGTWEEAIKEIIDTSVVQQGFEDSSARERPSGVPDDEMEVIPEEEALLRGMPLVVGVHPGEEARQEQIPSPGTPQTSSTTSSLTAAPGTPVGQLFDRPVIQQALTRARQAPLLENIQQAALRRGQPSDFQEELRQAMVRGRKRSASDLEAAREMQPAAGAEASGISDGLGPSVAEASGSASSTAGSPLTADVAQTSTSSRSPTNPPSVAPAATNEVNQTNLRIPFEALTMTREELENMAAGEDVHPLMKVQAMVEMDRQHPSTLFDREPDHGSWDGRWSMPGRTQWELFEKLGLDWPKGSSAEHSVEAATARKEMVWSKLGASQRKLWEAAAVKGWRAYTDNQAVQVLSEQETQRVKRDLARKGELDKILKPRWVMTDKAEGLRTATNPLPPEPSARLVVPGFKDRANLSGELRRDAPTGSRLAQHFLLSLLAWHSSTWSLYSADIKSAFLKGDPYLDRDLFLSNTDERAGPPIPGLPRGRLARVLKGIFGLADAPRRWWQRLSRSMETRKWIRSTIDQATWMLRDDSNNIIGIVVAHVDDLLFAGGSEAEQSLRSVGEELGFRELTKDKFTWCGKQFEKRGDGCVYLSMRAYHDNLKPIPVSSHRKGDLSAPLTSFEARQLRALLGSYQWLVTQLRFDMAFVVSSLQGETPTVGTLMRANAALVEFQKLRDFELRFQPVNPYTGGLMVVTDSALGNVMASGSATGAPLEKVFSQACYFVLLADEDLMQGRQGRFNIVDARSHRLARVCRSSYAAETLGAEEGFDVGQLCRGFLATVRGDSLHKQSVDQSLNAVPLTVVVDAKDVFDKASSDTSSFGSQKSLAFTIAWLRQILRRPNTSIRWTSTENMWADAGTKEMDLTHMRKIIRTGSWSVTYSPVFVKQVSKAKKRPAQASTPEDALPGKPVHGTDPILGHLMALCEERGWHSVGGMGVNVAFSARSFRTPEPRFTARDYPLRSSFARFTLSSGQAVWRVLERKEHYLESANQHQLLDCTAPILVTVFEPEEMAA